jgi:hypothetical protein
MVLRQAVTPSHRFSGKPAADVAPAGGMAEEVRSKRQGKLSYEHHHGHDERAEARL